MIAVIISFLAIFAVTQGFMPKSLPVQRMMQLKATIPLQTNQFDELVTKSSQVCLVDFYADWCGPCKLMAPIFEQLSEEIPDVKFVKVDTDVHEEVVERFNLQGLPLFGLFVNGKMVASHAGALKKDLLKEFVLKGIKTPA